MEATGLCADLDFSKMDFTGAVLFFGALRYQKPLPSLARGLEWAGWFDMLSGADIKSALLAVSSERYTELVLAAIRETLGKVW